VAGGSDPVEKFAEIYVDEYPNEGADWDYGEDGKWRE
jgi:hypothetical protein